MTLAAGSASSVNGRGIDACMSSVLTKTPQLHIFMVVLVFPVLAVVASRWCSLDLLGSMLNH